MKTLKELTAGIKPVIGYPKTIEFGPVTLEGFMLEDGTFRQGIRSTGEAMEMLSNANIQRIVARQAIAAQVGQPETSYTAVPINEKLPQKVLIPDGDPYPVIQPVICPGVKGIGGGVAFTINLPMVVEVWKQVAKSGGVNSGQALELLGLSAIHSLERTYQEAFGVTDSRSTSDRLLDWAIRLDPAGHFPLFGGQFARHFARVTGVTIGHRYAAVCMADLIYHRLPKPIYEKLKEINPMNENGWREFTHSQMMTDAMRSEVRGIVTAVTNQLANSPSKAEDPKAYAKLLKRLDKTMERHTHRGMKSGAPNNALAKWREEQSQLDEAA